ncbi:hypothetical protein BGZ80_004463 [Entomortierella chlamydospora]|uniref:PH domain-containing protein n=1 Tax=Entomortierella chlamydospora TaxID=101097 RepID=A0A9P6MML6_9FUNG|nr:hypothetical protein BGZ80_004463 [Entomortierella chlamydospora]
MSSSPRPLNPNTKWFINIASATNIRLLSITRSYRCFPYSDSSKELSIQTSDGRNVILRASKDIELDRWYFVLSKIWENQQQKSEAPSDLPLAARNLAAHQQSTQLFQKYLQKQYPDHQPEQHQVQKSSSTTLLRPHQNVPKDDINRSPTSGMVHQRSDCPAANSMEPGKAAIIDNWRRSLFISRHVEEKTSQLGESGLNSAATRDMDRTDGNTVSDLAGLHADSHDTESTLKDSSLGPECDVHGGAEIGVKTGELDLPHGLGIWPVPNEEDIDDNTPVGRRRSFCKLRLSDERNFQGNKRSSHLPGLTMPSLQKEKNLQDSGGHSSQDEAVQDLKALSADMLNPETKEEDELPLGLIQAKRQSRWLSTQLSSEDGVSVTQRNSQAYSLKTSHRLLLCESITPRRVSADLGSNAHSQSTMTASSGDMQRERHQLDIRRLTSSFSNPSPGFHRSSYSHLPIHNPDFVFPKSTQNAYLSANELPTTVGSSKVTQSAATVPAIPAADRGLFTDRSLRRGFSIPAPITESSVKTPSKKYVPVDITPYTSITTMNSDPPPRPTRPQDVDLSSSPPQFASQSAHVRLSTFKQHHRRRQPSLSRSISAMSSVSQAHLPRQSSQFLLASPYWPHGKLLDNRVDDEEDENESLMLTLSHQQNNKQQHRLSQRIYPNQRPISMASQKLTSYFHEGEQWKPTCHASTQH